MFANANVLGVPCLAAATGYSKESGVSFSFICNNWPINDKVLSNDRFSTFRPNSQLFST